ncbi:hypothetical protein K6119_02570 [Paracrocinitomix mangrovi]|uniref:tetratricopeptide repeat protein n=1 Tax=Paracrocinitomix mangrovi TaxID=2862509 RepID=UPI001C8DA7ED|nr:hypothetical protein [Paracrocinitomix mangrovi]UKN02403.1 hypothetical protein K6119_02570 [Paracrocinitomix mangrovi]
MSENIHYEKAVAKFNENQFEEAIELFSLALEINATDPFIYNQRAVCYLNLNQFDLSLFDMNRSIELDDKYAYFYSCRGFLKARMKDIDGALEDYEISIELDPENEITYNNMGLLLEQMGNMARAKQMFEKGNDILGYDPKKRELNDDQTHMVNAEEDSITVEKSENNTNINISKEKLDKILKEQKENKKKAKKQVAKDVFSKKSAFKEFLGFIGNGFKLKEDENKKDTE